MQLGGGEFQHIRPKNDAVMQVVNTRWPSGHKRAPNVDTNTLNLPGMK